MTDPVIEETEIDISGDGGVKKKILKEGEGEEFPSKGCRVSLHYTGTLLDGTQFDSSVERNVPFEFELGRESVRNSIEGCRVSLHYTGTLLDGTQFDSSVERNVPFEFELGRESVIKAFDMGVATMRKGEKCILTCAPEYAYGAAGSRPNIPPNATLKFELEMLSWELEDLSPGRNKGILRCILKASDKKRTPNEFAHVHVHLIGKHEGRVFEEREVKFNLGEGATADVVSGPEFAFGAEGNEKLCIPPNATVEYTVTLREFERAQDTWKMDPAESLEQARFFKEKGAKYIKEEKYQVAIKMFKLSNDCLSNCNEDAANTLKTAVFLNKALCYQKLGEPYEVKQACDTVLEIDSKSVKAYYRRGLAHVALGYLEKALEDFKE
uniref:peptidylprolyl isomerase n=1 Tax=Lutzomyia longipalpis TaxID=7200 RepID=A0A1B0CAC7_LUTLO